MPIKIPSKVVILEKTYDVIFKDNLSVKSDCHGDIWYQEAKIYLQPEGGEANRSRTSVEATFFHEIVHGILHTISEPELRDNEAFVGRFSKVLYHCLRESGMLKEEAQDGKTQYYIR